MPKFQQRARALTQYERVLREKLLVPLPKDPMAIFGSSEALLLKAYCVLLYAAIEECLEQTAIEVVVWHADRWKRLKVPQPTLVLLALCAYHGRGYKKQDKGSPKAVIAKTGIGDRLDEVTQAFKKLVESNHGIGLYNVKRLFRPLGMTIEVDPTTESALSQLREYRGEYAHRGYITKLPSVADIEAIADACLKLCLQLASMARSMC